jgi:hypothetical protein
VSHRECAAGTEVVLDINNDQSSLGSRHRFTAQCYTACIMNSNDLAKRIWQKDASLWKSDEDSVKIIKNALGWLTVADEMIGSVDDLVAFANSVRERGFQHVMVCGMGGSSLCPEVLARPGSARKNVR